MKLRAEAELTYARSLYRISERDNDSQLKGGLLEKEVNCFKQDCMQKAKAADELAQNIGQDCIGELQ